MEKENTRRTTGRIMLYLLYEMDELQFVKGGGEVNTVSQTLPSRFIRTLESDGWRGFYYEENSIK